YSCTTSGPASAPASTLTCVINASTSLFNMIFGNNNLNFTLTAVASNVGLTFRQLTNPSSSSYKGPQIGGINTSYANSPFGYNLGTATLNSSDASASIPISGQSTTGNGSVLAVLGSLTCTSLGIPLCYKYTITVPIGILADHPAIDPTNSTYSWFFRNKWNE